MRELSGETFSKLMSDLLKSLFNLVNSANNEEVVTGIVAINRLIELDVSSETRLIAQLRIPLSNTNPDILVMASSTLGRLAKRKESEIGDSVEAEIQSAISKLNSERVEHERLSAVLVLKELAVNAPSHFYSVEIISQFLSAIWEALTDSKVSIRMCALESLTAVLKFVSKRETSARKGWYTSLYNKINNNLKVNTVENVHGALLALGELLVYSGKSMHSHFKEFCETVSNYRSHKEKYLTPTKEAPKKSSFVPISNLTPTKSTHSSPKKRRREVNIQARHFERDSEPREL